MKDDYAKARKLAEKAYHRAIQQGHYPYLPALDFILEKEGPLPETTVGLMEIPTSMIVGTRTQGRQNAFAPNFMPLLGEDSEFSTKWAALYDSQMQEGIRDPLKVYEYMKRFYVLEGNKRVSVAKYLGIPSITAEVIRVLPKHTQEKESLVYYEFLDFFKVAPIYQITLSEPGAYRKLAEEVGQNLTEPWSASAIENVRSAYNTFEKHYMSLEGWRLDMTAGDAFLIYVTVYRLDSLLSAGQKEIRNRIQRIWNEFRTNSSGQPATLVERPIEPEKPGRLASVLKKTPGYTEKKPLRIAFLYERDPETSSWLYAHELGRQDLMNRFPGVVEATARISGTDEESFQHAVEEAVAAGAEMIFTTSPAQMEKTLRAAVEYPKIRFLNCSIHLKRNAVRTYYARMYEAKFLMGALAASVASNHRIGYVCDYPIYGNIANINAFAIGAALIDPNARIELKWSTEKDGSWQKAMWEDGIRVISGPELTHPGENSRAFGLYQMDENGGVMNLAAPMRNWGKYYELIVRTVLDGSWGARSLVKADQALNYWYGMASGVIDVVCSEKLSYYSRKLVSVLRNALVADTLNPFDGELRSQNGLIKEADAPRLSYEEIITMNWLNDNVIGRLPALEELKDTAKETVSVSGVEGTKKTD